MINRQVILLVIFGLIGFLCIHSVSALDNEHFQPLQTIRRQIQEQSSIVFSETSSSVDQPTLASVSQAAGDCTFGGQMGQCTSTSLPCAGVRYSGLCFGKTDVQCCIASNKAKYGVYGNEQPKISQTTLQRLSETQHREKWARFKKLFNPQYKTPTEEQEGYMYFRENRIRTIYLNDRFGGGNVIWSSATPFANVKSTVFSSRRSNAKFPTPEQAQIIYEQNQMASPILLEIDNNNYSSQQSSLDEKDEHWAVFQRLVTAVEKSENDQGINSDLTTLVESFSSISTATSTTTTSTVSIQEDFGASKVGGVLSVDHRPLMQPIRDQGECGSCWAHTTTAVIEGSAAKNGVAVNGPLAPQWFLDCDSKAEQSACNGGDFRAALRSANERVPASEAEMPYLSTSTTGQCPASFVVGGHSGLKVTKTGMATMCDVRRSALCEIGNESGLLAALTKYGPIAVAMDSSSLQSYHGGIIQPDACTSKWKYLDHAVTLVGYGKEENGQEFWLIRNTWSANWGEEGHFRLRANVAKPVNTCGITNMGSYAVVGRA